MKLKIIFSAIITIAAAIVVTTFITSALADPSRVPGPRGPAGSAGATGASGATAACASAGVSGLLCTLAGNLTVDAGFNDTISVTAPTFSATVASGSIAYQTLSGGKMCYLTGGTGCLSAAGSTLFSTFQPSAPNYLATSATTAPWSSGLTSDQTWVDNGNSQFIATASSRTKMQFRAGGSTATELQIDGTTNAFSIPGAGSIAWNIGAPTLTSFGGTGTSVTGTGLAFDINVGTVAPGSTGTITMANAASNGYVCNCYNFTTTTGVNKIIQTGGSTTTCIIAQVVGATNVASNWTASDHVRCSATGF